PEIYTLSLHDALPIYVAEQIFRARLVVGGGISRGHSRGGAGTDVHPALLHVGRVDGRRSRLKDKAIAAIRDAIRDSRIATFANKTRGCASPGGFFRLRFAQSRVAQLDLVPIL